MARGGGKGDTLEIISGITENANRVALKGVFANFGDVLACWVPPVDRRGSDAASVRFSQPSAAEAALQACESGHVFFQGLPLKARWKTSGGPRIGNSDIGGSIGGRSPERGARRYIEDGPSRGRRSRSRSRRRRRKKSSSEKKEEAKGDAVPALENQPSTAAMLAAQYGMGVPGMPQGMPGYPGYGQMQAMPNQWDQMMPGALPPPPTATGMVDVRAIQQLTGGPMEPPPMPTAEDLAREVAEREKRKERAAQRASEMKKGPGVAALVQNALKKAQAQKKESDYTEKEEAEKEAAKKAAEEKAAAQKMQQKEAEKRRMELDRKNQEEERKKAKEEASLRAARIREGIEAAKKEKVKETIDPNNLYGDMPEADQESEQANNRARQAEAARAPQAQTLPQQTINKVIFLDVDGVLRPARAGGFEAVGIDGGTAIKADTSDFFAGALQALRHVIERTGAVVVLSSEWRRDETLREAINKMLVSNGMRPVHSCTTVALERDMTTSDVLKSFAERRAREISEWLSRHEHEVREWVVIDDVNLAIADEQKKPTTKPMGPRLVQTVPLFGLTMGNAKTAVRILLGELIQKVVVKKSLPTKPTEPEEKKPQIGPSVGPIGPIGPPERPGVSGLSTPMPGGGGFATPMPGGGRMRF